MKIVHEGSAGSATITLQAIDSNTAKGVMPMTYKVGALPVPVTVESANERTKGGSRRAMWKVSAEIPEEAYVTTDGNTRSRVTVNTGDGKLSCHLVVNANPALFTTNISSTLKSEYQALLGEMLRALLVTAFGDSLTPGNWTLQPETVMADGIVGDSISRALAGLPGVNTFDGSYPLTRPTA